MGSNDKTISYNGDMVQAPLPRLLLTTHTDEKAQLIAYLQPEFAWVTDEHPDLHWLNQPTEPLTIDDVRRVKSMVDFQPYQADRMIVVIHQVQSASVPAQNALLKLLEEPPATVQLILTTSQVAAVLPTVVSRCIVVTLEENEPPTLTDLPFKIEELPHATFGQLVDIADTYTNRDEALALTHQLTTLLYQRLAMEPHLARHLEAITAADQQLRQNLNVKLVIGELLFALKRL